jgi:hypothetical protein
MRLCPDERRFPRAAAFGFAGTGRDCRCRVVTWELGALIALVLLGWLWFDSMRARERAVAAGRSACERERLQFLDETVECVSLRPARGEDGRLLLRRVYRFEFSDTGDNRRVGSVVMLGGEVESLTMEPFLLQ